jgi:type 1 glutamine amidotransferase
MRRLIGRLKFALFLVTACLLTGARAEPLRVLVFSKTTGFRHASIADGIDAVEALGAQYGFEVDATEDAALFTDAGLAPYNAVVFLSTTGQVLDGPQEDAFERFIQAGNGFVGIHAAADPNTTGTHFWPWYVELLGARFLSHPAQQNAIVNVVDHEHPSTSHLGNTWTRFDEWYEFSDYNENVTLLLELDGDSYDNNGGIDGFFPHAWYHEFDGGRSWYTAGGHTSGSYAEPDFRRHLAGGILWSAALAGDFNRDHTVDAVDYTIWRNSLGEVGPGLPADVTGPDGLPDGTVDLLDYASWKANYGKTAGGGAFSTSSITQHLIPEPPASRLLMLTSLLGLSCRKRIL